MLELAANGAKVLNIRATEYARRHGVTLHVRSSFTHDEGTIVYNPTKGQQVEEPIITGVAGDLSEAKITVVGVPDVPGKAAQIFTIVANADINIDMIVQNVSHKGESKTDISFTLPKTEGERALDALRAAADDIGFAELSYDDQIGKLSVVGAGMRTNSGVSAQLFTALFEAGVNIDMISTSEIRISVILRSDQLNDAMRRVHSAFGLDAAVEAVVHAGTGR
jgi:aspartate kinase